jgi:hypothetical protein
MLPFAAACIEFLNDYLPFEALQYKQRTRKYPPAELARNAIHATAERKEQVLMRGRPRARVQSIDRICSSIQS